MDSKEKQKNYRKERYNWLKEHHICVVCGKKDALGKYVRCAECLQRCSINDYKRYHKKRQEQGKEKKCYFCSDPAVKGRTQCARHLEYHRLKMRQYRGVS